MDCCGRGYDEVFTARQARGVRRRYLRKGLGQPARTMAALLSERGLKDATVLEIGGGVGDLHVDLLRRGAATATNVELVTSWDEDAAALLAEHRLTDRVTRLVGDLVDQPGLAGGADVVVLNRVVCCYPDYEGLLKAAGERAGRLLVFSHPPSTRIVRMGLRLINAWEGLRGRDYRAFAHSPGAMLAVLAGTGLRRVAHQREGVWTIHLLERADDAARTT